LFHYIKFFYYYTARKVSSSDSQEKHPPKTGVSSIAKELRLQTYKLPKTSHCGMSGALRKHLKGGLSTWRNPLLTQTRRDGTPERRWVE